MKKLYIMVQFGPLQFYPCTLFKTVFAHWASALAPDFLNSTDIHDEVEGTSLYTEGVTSQLRPSSICGARLIEPQGLTGEGLVSDGIRART